MVSLKKPQTKLGLTTTTGDSIQTGKNNLSFLKSQATTLYV